MPLNSGQLNDVHSAFQQSSGVSSIEFDVPKLPPLLRVAVQLKQSQLFYFSLPHQTSEWLAIGCWEAFDEDGVRRFWEQLSNHEISLVGGAAFNQDATASELPAEQWVLPKVILRKQDEQWRCQMILDCRNSHHTVSDSLAIIDELNRIDATEILTKPLAQSVAHVPLKEEWVAMVSQAQHQFRDSALSKVVLARQSQVEFDQELNPFCLMTFIQANDPGLIHFVQTFDNGAAFIGGTPERLFELVDSQLTSEAIAGTFKKGAEKQQVLNQQKERDEHQYVADYIEAALTNLCVSPISTSTPSTLELKYLIHLIQEFSGQCGPGISPLDVINGLHPTPAVGGTPQRQALDLISELEPFSREWYAGPVGMLSHRASRIVVAIRSGIVKKNRVTLFSGAGITNESRPDREWDELNLKLMGFMKVFNQDDVNIS
ncbi:MAG: isochorismate synthase [Candidatus Marinamargulisbacteria bacterium]